MRAFQIPHLTRTLSLALALAAAPILHAADSPEQVYGPFWSGTIMSGKTPVANKGMAVILGANKDAYMVYDLDTMRMAAAWTGDFLNYGNALTKIEWPQPPQVKGVIQVSSANGPGWADAKGAFVDPRERQQGPMPKDWIHYEGAYVNAGRVILSYKIDGTSVLELPGVETVGGNTVFTRTIQFLGNARDLALVVATGNEAKAFVHANNGSMSVKLGSDKTLTFLGEGANPVLWDSDNGHVVVKIPKVARNSVIRIATVASGSAPADAVLPSLPPMTKDLRPLLKGGPARWNENITSTGVIGTEDGPYQVDTITEPFPNPYKTRTFWGGFDFLPDGRAVICAWHGDVWIVSGIDAKLDKLTWKRFATGLFQPLGVKVRNGEIYVVGRDQITHLKDLNKDGEADFYENFNNDTVVTPNYHEFVLDLHTDPQGNFYFAKGAAWPPDTQSPSQGTLNKVSKDGSKLEVIATGFRAPNGMTVGPDGTILVGDNQGHWMPSSKLNLIKKGGFYGMVPTAHHELKLRYPDGKEITTNPSLPEERAKYGLKGFEGAMPIPESYDQPIAWVPMRWDNSSGGQVYVDSKKWGPWDGAPLFMSYGKCLLYGVMMDNVDGTEQATLTPFGLKFASGIMRGRTNPKDGQLYFCGLKGWQNSASRDGGFYRVRYTGKPANMPIKTHVAANGIQITFSDALDAKAAVDSENYGVELWNYFYSGNYGSPENSVKNPGQKGHDRLEVKGATLSADKKTVFLKVDGLEPADQFSVKYLLKSAAGAEISSELIGTIHKLGKAIQ
jgi:hypothetical protein